MIVTIDNRKKTITAEPALIHIYAGRSYYEHPLKGDEAPLLEKVAKDTYVTTDFWEADDIHA